MRSSSSTATSAAGTSAKTSASYWAKNDIPTYPEDPQKDQKGAYCSVLFYHVLSWSCESCWVVSVASRIGKDKAAQRCQNPQPLPVPRIPPSLASAPKALQWTCAVLVSIGTVHKNENPARPNDPNVLTMPVSSESLRDQHLTNPFDGAHAQDCSTSVVCRDFWEQPAAHPHVHHVPSDCSKCISDLQGSVVQKEHAYSSNFQAPVDILYGVKETSVKLLYIVGWSEKFRNVPGIYGWFTLIDVIVTPTTQFCNHSCVYSADLFQDYEFLPVSWS